ncbi:MAG: hypothetical protein LBQ61_05560, partial [Spirochaetales bacterium]|nr:hypothetical protein [Spirochaetales bacterium]
MKKIPAAALLFVMLGTGSVSALSLTTYPGAVSQGNLLFNAGAGWGKPRNGSLNLPPLQFSLDMP